MFLNKKILYGGIGAGVLIIVVVLFMVFSNPQQHIEDTNGTFTILNTLDFAEAAANLSSVSKGSYTLADGIQSGVTSEFDYADFETVGDRAIKFSGSKVLQSTYLRRGEILEVYLTATLDQGNFEIGLVDEDFNVIEKYHISNNNLYFYTATYTGEVYVVIVGESAQYSLEIWRAVTTEER